MQDAHVVRLLVPSRQREPLAGRWHLTGIIYSCLVIALRTCRACSGCDNRGLLARAIRTGRTMWH
jgi:hypothetical protein